MSEYREIKGQAIQNVTADLSDNTEGQIWYNSTARTFKSVLASEAWSSGSPLITARNALYGSGSQTAGLAIGGEDTAATGATEEYNGSGWASGGPLSTARYHLAAAGTQTSSIAFGGDPGSAPSITNATEEYDGSSWTAGGNLPVAKLSQGGAGTLTAGLSFGGATTAPITASSNTTEEYDGSTWTAGGNLNIGKHYTTGAGTQTAGLNVSGAVPPGNTLTAASEEYNGTSWTSGNSSNTAKLTRRAFGLQTSAVLFGGESPYSTATETYDGTSWSTSPATLSTAISNSAQSGTNGSAGLQAGGYTGTADTSISQEYNKSINVITAAAWASANSPSSPVYGGATGGTPTAAFLAAGFGTGAEPSTQKTFNQHYNGTSWSEENDLNTARFYVGGAGTQTASLVFGGRIVPSPPVNNNSEEYDGSSWTAGNTIGTARQFGGSNGTQTAALAIGGTSPTNAVEEYDGTNWTSGTVYPTSDTGNAVRSVGPQTAAFAVGGSPATTNTNFYDGSTWTAGPSAIAPTGEGNMSGSQTVAIKAGGNLGGSNYTNQSIRYDGTSWATSANLGTGRAAMPSGPSGDFSSTTALCFGGPLGAPTYEANQLEEFTGETSALNLKTLTTS